MPERERKRAKLRQICIGDLRQRVRLLERDLEAPGAGETDFSLTFKQVANPYARVDTKTGKVFFDTSAELEVPITHEVWMRFRKDVDTESWLELQSGTRLRVLSAEDLDERHEWLRLTCTERGPGDIPVARA